MNVPWRLKQRPLAAALRRRPRISAPAMIVGAAAVFCATCGLVPAGAAAQPRLFVVVKGLSSGGPTNPWARYAYPNAVAWERDYRSFLIAGSERVRRVDPAGRITTVAGTGTAGFSGDGGPAVAAQLNQPTSVTAAPDGSFFIADRYNNRVRRVGRDGTISTFAGTGVDGFSSDGGPATLAGVSLPSGVDVTADGSVLIAASGNYRVRRVAPAGTITTVTRTRLLYGVTGARDGSVLIPEPVENRVRRVGRDGSFLPAVLKGSASDGRRSQCHFPTDVAEAPDGTFLVVCFYDNRVLRVLRDGRAVPFAGTGFPGRSGDGAAARSARLDRPTSLDVAPDGRVLITDTNNHRVVMVVPHVLSVSGPIRVERGRRGRALVSVVGPRAGLLRLAVRDRRGMVVPIRSAGRRAAVASTSRVRAGDQVVPLPRWVRRLPAGRYQLRATLHFGRGVSPEAVSVPLAVG